MRDWRQGVRERHAADIDPDLLEELVEHCAHRYAELIRSGTPEAAAAAQALDEVGDVIPAEVRRPSRSSRATVPIGSARARAWSGLREDIRHAVRGLRLHAGFSAGAVLTYTIGVAGAVTMFAILSGVLLRPLPYAEPERLVRVSSWSAGGARLTSALDFLDWRRAAGSFAALGLTAPVRATLLDEGVPESVASEVVSEGMLEVLGVRPALGRTLNAGDTEAGAAPAILISDALWRRRWGGDPGVVGRPVVVDGARSTIVGVLPPGFRFLDRDVDVYQAVSWEGSLIDPANRGMRQFQVYARLARGVDVGVADAEMARIAAQLSAQWPDQNARVTTRVVSLRESLVGEVREALLLLFVAVGFLLLIACTNLLNLLLTRASRRQGDIAIRLALGASRPRLIRQSLVETLLLCGLGTLAGLLIARAALALLPALAADRLPRLSEISVDGTVVLFALATTLLSTLLVGLPPALHATRPSAIGAVRRATRGTGGARGSQRVRSLLAGWQVACAVVLVAAAGLLVRSLVRLQAIDPGFEAEGVVTFDVATAAEEFPERVAFYEQLLDALRAQPAVSAAGATFELPLAAGNMTTSLLEPVPAGTAPADRPPISVRIITPGYLDAMRIPLRRGRDFTSADGAGSEAVVLVSEEAARRYWPGIDPIGRQVQLDLGMRGKLFGGRVVGIVAPVRHASLTDAAGPEVYLPQTQAPVEEMTVVTRTSLAPADVARAAREALARIDPNVPVTRAAQLRSAVAQVTATPRFYSLLVGMFAVLSLSLAAVGVYAVVAFAVEQRAREFGIRLALGAQPRALLRSVLLSSLRFVLAGIAVGVVVYLALGRWLASLAWGVHVGDAGNLAAVSSLLLVVGALAALHPARRATRVQPTSVMNAP